MSGATSFGVNVGKMTALVCQDAPLMSFYLMFMTIQSHIQKYQSGKHITVLAGCSPYGAMGWSSDLLQLRDCTNEMS